MPMISQKRKRPLVSTRIPPLPSQSRCTSAIGAPPTFRQERNRPDILRQTYLSRTQSHSMGGVTRSDTPQLEPRNIDPPRPWRENTIPSSPCTRSQTMSGPNETSLHHTQSQGAAGSQLDDTHNDLPTEAPARKRSAVRRRHGSVNGSVPNLPDERPVRGACRLVKTNRIVRITQAKIKVVIDPVHRRATDKVVHSLLAHDTGAIVRQHCPMNTAYWKRMSDESKSDLVSEITVNFDLDTNIQEHYDYVDRLMSRRYKEFKYELHAYFLEWASAEEALANPPIEMESRPGEPGQWEFLCEHFQSEKFLKQSEANKKNRAQKKYEHHAGSRPLAYIVEECTQAGSQFPEIDTFEIAYAGKNKHWTNETAKSKFDEMLARKEDYLNELAKDYPEDTPLNEIVVPDQDVGLHILNDVLGVKPGKQIRGLGDGRVRELGGSTSRTSLRARQLEEELVEERAARQAADAAREAADQRIVASDTARAAAEQTLAVMMQTWQHSMVDLAARVPGWEPPSLIIPPQTQPDQHVAHDENYNENE
ncbi:hypothetical protein ACFX12_018690 [Malus domestica]